MTEKIRTHTEAVYPEKMKSWKIDANILKDFQLSEDVIKQLRNDQHGHIEILKNMHTELKAIKDFEKSAKKLEHRIGKIFSQNDLNLLKSTGLTRMNDLNDIENKAKTVNSLFKKYDALEDCWRTDGLMNLGGSPRRLNILTPEDRKIIHDKPLETVADWIKKHARRVELLNELTSEGLIPGNEYQKYRSMTPEQSLKKLIQIRNTRNERNSKADIDLEKNLSELS